jgi:putative endonuclease
MSPASERALPGESRSRGQNADPRRALGARGEQLAAAHLRRLGYDVVARNVRTRHGEIDLIAADRDALVFVEVKTRRLSARQCAARVEQDPLRGLGARQQARLRRLAAAWLAESRDPRPRPPTIRFDAIGVVVDSHDRLRSIEHVEGAW